MICLNVTEDLPSTLGSQVSSAQGLQDAAPQSSLGNPPLKLLKYTAPAMSVMSQVCPTVSSAGQARVKEDFLLGVELNSEADIGPGL